MNRILVENDSRKEERIRKYKSNAIDRIKRAREAAQKHRATYILPVDRHAIAPDARRLVEQYPLVKTDFDSDESALDKSVGDTSDFQIMNFQPIPAPGLGDIAALLVFLLILFALKVVFG